MDDEDDLLGTVVDGRTLTSLLGEGGMGRVYRAADPDGGDDVAVKVLHPRLTGDAEAFERFAREARLGMEIEHEGVVRTLDVGTARVHGRELHFLVMELVHGQTLRALLGELGRVPEALCLHVAAEVAGALGAIHAAGVVHRDLKPENVLITPSDEIKLMDLGVARLMDEAVRLSRTGQFVGSLRYAAPEQLEAGVSIDGTLDLWALGVLLYELATGVQPFDAETLHQVIQRILTLTPAPPSSLAAGVSPFFDRLVAALLTRAPSERPPSAGVVETLLADGFDAAWWAAATRAEDLRVQRAPARLTVSTLTACRGRTSALQALDAELARATRDGARVVHVEGEAGVGKTRLLDTWLAALQEPQAGVTSAPAVFAGSVEPGGAATTHGVLARALRGALSGSDLAAVLRTHLQGSPATAETLAALLSGAPRPEGAVELTPVMLQGLFAELLRRLADGRPLVLVLDDMQRAPAATWRLIGALRAALGELPLLFVLASREPVPQELASQLAELGCLSTMPLGRLDEDAVRAILDELFAADLAVEDLVGPLVERTGGNPRFLFAALERLGEEGVLVPSPSGAWRVHTLLDVSTLDLPDSVRAAMASRLAGLSEEERELLQVAATIGSPFDPSLVARVLELKPLVVLRTLSRLERRARLVRAEGRVVHFDHPQLVDALYTSTPELLREALHGAIADVLAGDGAEVDWGSDAGVARCRHLLAGGRGAEALPGLDAVLEFLNRTYRRAEVVELTDAALGTPDLVDGALRSTCLLHRAHALNSLGHRTEAVEALEASLVSAPEGSSLCTRALCSLGWHAYTMRDLTTARAKAEEGRRLSIEGGHAATLGRAERILGLIETREGHFDEARRRLRVARDIAEEIGDDRLRMNALLNLGTAVALADADPAAAEHFEQALAIARRLGAREIEQAALGNLTYLTYLEGAFEKARTLNEEALEIASQIGFRSGQATIHGNLAWVLADLGRYAEAERHAKRQVALAEAIQQLDTELNGLACLAELRLRVGDVHAARALVERRRGGSSERPIHVGVTHLLAGRLAEAEDRTDEALRAFRAAISAFRAGNLEPDVLKALLFLATVLDRLEKTDELKPVVEEIHELGTRLDSPRALVLASVFDVATGEGSPEEAMALLERETERVPIDDRIDAYASLYRSTGDARCLVRARVALADVRADLAASDVTGFDRAVLRNRRLQDAAGGAPPAHRGG